MIFVLNASSRAFGIVAIFFGIILFRLQQVVGPLAAVSVVFELIVSFFFLSVIFELDQAILFIASNTFRNCNAV